MTGDEFKAALKAADYNQGEFAAVMGVHRTAIGRQCAAEEVDRVWVFALAGLVAAKAAGTVTALVADCNMDAE